MTSTSGRIPLDPDAWLFLVPLLAVLGIGVTWSILWLGLLAMAGIVMVAAFFRDPTRRGPAIPGALWSPADGEIKAIEDNSDPTRGPAPGKKIVIFLSVLNCHINRSPCAGAVERIRYERGEFRNALDPASSDLNECNWVFIRAPRYRVTVRQIAGLIARRIVCRVREGDSLRRGQRIGLIRFGSRTELYVPPEAEIRCFVGQKVKGGRSVLAVMPLESSGS